jgi:hypothetical protein
MKVMKMKADIGKDIMLSAGLFVFVVVAGLLAAVILAKPQSINSASPTPAAYIEKHGDEPSAL